MPAPAIEVLRRIHIDQHTIKCGPLTFVRRDSGEHEAWDVQRPPDLDMTHFCVKNYGGKPCPTVDGYVERPFTGWRVVSGGPFTTVGGWSSRDEAIAGATPWLIAYYLSRAKEMRLKASRVEAALADMIGELTT